MNQEIKTQIIPPHVGRFIKWGKEDFEFFWEKAAIKAQDESSRRGKPVPLKKIIDQAF